LRFGTPLLGKWLRGAGLFAKEYYAVAVLAMEIPQIVLSIRERGKITHKN
jgi:hypothetical protein